MHFNRRGEKQKVHRLGPNWTTMKGAGSTCKDRSHERLMSFAEAFGLDVTQLIVGKDSLFFTFEEAGRLSENAVAPARSRRPS